MGIIILIIGRMLDVFSTWVWLSKTGWHTEDEIAPISKLILEKDGFLGLIIFNSLFIFFFILLYVHSTSLITFISLIALFAIQFS